LIRFRAAVLAATAGLGSAGALEPAEPVGLGPGPTLSVPASGLTVRLTGYLQGDARSFRNWEAGDEDTGLLRSDATELRRLRLGFEGEWKRLGFEVDFDPLDDGDHLKDAYVDLKIARALEVRAGHFKLPVCREFLTSSSKTDFVERALLATHVGPARDLGVMVSGEIGRLAGYQAGVFAGDGRTRRDRSETTVAARIVLNPVKSIEVGASYSSGDVEAETEAPGVEVRALGFLGEGPAGFEFYEPRFVNGRRLRWGADGAVTSGPVSVKAEFLQGREERLGQGALFEDLPEQVVSGWSVSATWLLTGEKKKRTIEPAARLFRGPGAIEVGARYESLRFDDAGPDTGFEGAGNRARNIRPAGDRIVTAGLSWWPAAWVRFLGNVVVERFEDPLLAPEPGRRGSYVTLLGRLQLQVP
jgi:phosphate-selective porin